MDFNRTPVVSNLNLEEFRALVVEIDDDAAPYIVAAISNFNREGHTPTELSDAIHRLSTGLKVPMPEIARIFGFSEHYTYQLHGLQNLHEEVRGMLDPRLAKDRILPTTAAIQISKLHQGLQVAVANRVLNRELSVKGLRGEVVRVGEIHGQPVRTREVKPHHQWASILNTARVAAENAREIRDRARNPESAKLIANQEKIAIGALLFQIEETIRFAREAEALIQSGMKTPKA